MPVTKIKNTPTEREKIMQGMVQYTTGKEYKQAASRGFLAGVKFYKEQILNESI